MEQYFKHKIRSKNIGTVIGWILLGIIGAIALALFLVFGIMWLWNWLMPGIFGLTTIGYWQAIGLFALAKVLLENCDSSGSSKKKEKKSSEKNDIDCNDFSKWKNYDQFWKEEGEEAFISFVNKTTQEEE